MRDLLNKLIGVFAFVGDYTILIGRVSAVTLRRPPRWALIRDQLYVIGVQSIPVVAITGFSTGLILATQAYYQMSQLGLGGATGLFVAKSMVTELGPVLTAVMVTGRVGAAMCAELGTMRVSEQIDALQSMAVNPMRYLVAPRFIAGSLMVPPLTIFSTLLGIVGGYLISVHYFGLAPATYLAPLPTHIKDWDIIAGLVKAFFFGIILTTVACYKGMTTTGGAAGVGKATTDSVVISYTLILVTNFFLNIILNTLHQSWFPSL